jgi:hypothetical protein
MKKDNSDSYFQWEDDFDKKKKRKSTLKRTDYKRKTKYKNNYFDDEY